VRGAPPSSRLPPAPPPKRFDPPASGVVGKAPQSRLVGLEGALEGVEFPLDQPELGIGRRPDCDIRISEHGVSRLHAWVRATPSGYVIEDAGSANGTWINDVCAEGPVPLAEGDVIRIGPCSFVFHGEQHGLALPPGSMTVVADVGHDPSPFGDPLLAENAPSDRHATPAFLPSPWSEAAARPVQPPVPPAPPAPRPDPPRRPAPAAPPAPRPDPQPVQALREQLTGLNRDLGSYIQRLETVADSLNALEGQLSDARPAASAGPLPSLLQELRDELAAAGGIDQYRALEALLDELRADPTDLRLLLRLSDQLPLVNSLLQAYLRALAALDRK
jgi:pSer/pThr/pTyr-binding forkhead associated (FHA) protein